MASQSSEIFSINLFNFVEEICGVPYCSGNYFFLCNLFYHYIIENNANNFNLDFSDEVINSMAIIRKGEIFYGKSEKPIEKIPNKMSALEISFEMEVIISLKDISLFF